MDFPKTAYGTAQPANMFDLENDEHGYTNPNLHRRIDPKDPEEGSEETRPRDYIIGIYDGLHSIRRTETFYHDEESTTCEIP